MKAVLHSTLVFVLTSFAVTGVRADSPTEPAQVMLMGTFHFSSPMKDAVKTRNIDISTAASQAYIEALCRRITERFRPTRVLLEYSVNADAAINARYHQYRDGDYELPVNEVYQVGFRVAKLSGVERVGSFDHQDIEWQAEPMLEYAQQHDPAALAAFNRRIEQVTAKMQQDQDTLSLQALLALQNEPATFAENKALYVDTNDIGAGDGFAGADATASWWHRNFRMYALIQQAAQPGERVFVLGGSGHIAIIADMLELDSLRIPVDVRPLLNPAPADD